MILDFVKTGETTHYAIKCSVVYGTNWYPVRLNQSSVLTVDGTRSTFDIGPTMIKGNILIKGATPIDGSYLLRDFFSIEIMFKRNSFYVYQFDNNYNAFPEGVGVDLGVGKGKTISQVYLDTEDYSLDGMFTLAPPNVEDINIPFIYRRIT